MAGFSLLPYLSRQQDPFSAVLAGKLQAQKVRNDTVKWLANYQMQLQRMQMSKDAAGRAQEMHNLRMKQLRSRGSGSGPIRPGSLMPSYAGPQVQGAANPYAIATRPGDIIANGGMFAQQGQLPAPSIDRFNTLGGFGFSNRAPAAAPTAPANPFARPAAQPAAPDTGPATSTTQGFSDAGGIATDQMDAGTDTKLAALDEDPYANDDNEDDNPFSAFA